MKIRVNNTASDTIDISYEGKKRKISANVIDVTDGITSQQLPSVAINTVELNYHKTSNIKPKTSLIQSVAKSLDRKELHNTTKVRNLTKNYRDLLAQNPNCLVDFAYQWPQKQNLTNNEITTINNIQYDAGAKIISVYESNRNQTADDFETEILDARSSYRDCTIVPVIDIGIVEENLFAKKINKVLQNGFAKCNIIFRSIPENQVNWIDLSELIAEQSIWINVIGVSQRWYNTKLKISQMSQAFLYGVHSASQAYPWSGTPHALSYVLNDKTLCYDINKQVNYAESRAISANVQYDVLSTVADRIKQKTFYKNYVPSRFGLNYSFHSLT